MPDKNRPHKDQTNYRYSQDMFHTYFSKLFFIEYGSELKTYILVFELKMSPISQSLKWTWNVWFKRILLLFIKLKLFSIEENERVAVVVGCPIIVSLVFI